MLALAVSLSSCAQESVASDQLAADLAARAGDAVFAVAADGCGWRMRGTAFAIGRRHLVTNRHVIANDSSPTVTSRDGQTHPGKVIGSTADPDVAVIEVSEDLPTVLSWAPTESLKEREPLVTIGYPDPRNEFTASPGQIVNFQGPNGVREAALANTPVDHGNSGGPGLRANASVAGVVTLMLLPKPPAERVAVMFTADTVRPSVTDFIERPRYVRSTCGLGPDYVPPVPREYDISEPPPTAKPPVVLPTPRPTAARAAPTTDPVANYPQYTDPPRAPCPEGDAPLRVDEFTATEQPENPGWWWVHIKGVVINRSSAEIYAHRIDIHITGDPNVQGSTATTPQNIAAGESAPWEFGDASVHSPDGAPTEETTEISLTWRWRGDAISCPTGTPGPSPT